MNSSLDPTGTTVKDGTSGSCGISSKPYGKILSAVVDSVEATSGVLWRSVDASFQVLNVYPESESSSNLLLDPAVETRMLKRVDQSSGPVLCHPEQSTQAASAIVFGKLLLDETIIVGLTIPVGRLKETDLDVLKRRFVQTLQAVAQSQKDVLDSKRHSEQRTTGRTQSFGIRELNLYLKSINGSIETPKVAANIANETRRLLDCDRVSVVLRKHGRFCLQAVSGQHSINRRSQTTHLLEKVAGRVLSARQALWYPDDSLLPTQISQPLGEYLSASAVRNLVVIPLFSEDCETDAIDAPVATMDQQSVIGGIVFEHYQTRWDRTAVEPAVSMLTEHCGLALRNAMQHQKIFLLPIWKALGKSKLLTTSRMLPKLAVSAVTVFLLFSVLCFWTVDFYVTANGILIPENFRPVFASVEGKVDQVLVQHGDYVSKGDTLLTMSSPEHDLRIKEVESSLMTARQRLTIVQDQRYKTRSDDPQKIEENLISLSTQIESLEAQLKILQKISKSMTVVSPLDGQMVTWDLGRKLENRVVSAGMQLLEVATVDGEWLLEIELPIQKQGHVQRALNSKSVKDLAVSFLLASDTRRRYSGHVVKIENSVALNSSNQQVLKIWAAIDEKDISLEQLRTGVTARVYCDQTSLGYLWFHGLGEYFTRNVFFRYF